MNYVAIDFETANDEGCPCQVGVIIVKDGEVSRKFSTLIKPKDGHICWRQTKIHGITSKDVKDKPEFPEIWASDLKNLLEGNVVFAHNAASADMSYLRKTLDLYELSYPEFTYFCTKEVAKKTWPDFENHDLPTVAKKLGIEFEHHKAEEDAWACSEIVRLACIEKNCENVDDLMKSLCLSAEKFGHARSKHNSDSQTCSKSKSRSQKIKELQPSTDSFDVEHPFYGKMFAFTKTKHELEAMQNVLDVGGKVDINVTKKTNYLVVGEEVKTGKTQKAEDLRATGQDIEIITVEDFRRRLKSSK